MAEQKNSFEKGLIKDVNPNKQPENSYLNAVNFVRLSSEGDYYSFTNERGTEIYVNLTSDFSIIGQTVLESDIILILCKNDNTASQIGIVASDGIFTVKLDDINNELNLDTDHPIDIQARVLINTNRIVYFVDNKNVIRTIDLDDVPTIGNIDKLSTLVPSSDFPIISNFEVKDSSTNLKCGAYQFAFRYLNNKGNLTNISIPSGLVSIGQNSTSAGYQYQGGYSNIVSGKSITLSISNVDTDYDKLEVIAVYYNENNELISNVTAQINIENNTSITYEYRGNIIYNISIEELQGVTTNYSTAKCIEQKDGRLFISNLKESNNIEANLQNIANNITLKYIIDTVDVNAYKDGNNTATKVGYKRGEVYSFGFGVVYKNGAKSFVYHIPAPDTLSGTTGEGTIVTYANTGTKILGTYKSTLQYPSGQNYPDQLNGYTSSNIRYHVMPTFEQEIPFSITDINTGSINVLGIEPEFPAGTQADWDAIKGQIQGIFIVRRSRDSSENTSIFSQGITNYLMDNFKINTGDGEDAVGGNTNVVTVGGNDFRMYNILSKYLVKAPFLGGIKLQGYFPSKTGTWNGSTSGNDALQTINQPLEYTYIASDPEQEALSTLPVNALTYNGYGSGENIPLGQLYKRLLVWYSPESELLPKVEANTFTKIKRVGQFEFVNQDIRWEHSAYENEDSWASDGESEMIRKPLYWTWFYPTDVSATGYSNSLASINKNYYIPRNTSVLSTYETVNIDNTGGEEFLLLETEDNTLPDNENTRVKYKVQNVDAAGGATMNDAIVVDNPLLKNIYELVSENTSQYGNVSEQEYVICKYLVYNQTTTPDLDSFDGTDIYGGDTYITRVSFTNKSAIKSKHYAFSSANNQWHYATNAQATSYGRDYLDFRSIIEFYVESTKNTDLRHSITGGNIYHRYNDANTVLSTNPMLIDDTKSYNNQYDFENRIQLFYSKSDISSAAFSHYKTRTIWSDQTILGELRDRYRDIRINNFNDLPFNTGEIWDSFVFNNIFYLHTPKTLWRTYVNSIEQSASTAGQVTLGTGGVFPVNLPPQQVINQQGGYGGTISQWGGCNTPFGRIFPDALQGKVFILTGEGLQELSAIGMNRYFQDNLSVLNDTYTGYDDNPFKYGSRGILSAYDFELKRWLMVKNHEDPLKRFTISYDVISKQWTSFHTYQPNILISRDNRLFGLMNIENTGTVNLHEHNIGDYGIYYNNSVEDSVLSIVVNAQGDSEKVFDNLVLDLDSSTTTKIQAYRGTGDTIQVYNHRQHTGVTNLIWNNTYGVTPARNEARVQMLRNNYNIKIPLNSLISDNNAIFDSNGVLINSNIDQDKLFRDRIKGDFCIIQFNFNNSDNYKLTLNEIVAMFRAYKR